MPEFRLYSFDSVASATAPFDPLFLNDDIGNIFAPFGGSFQTGSTLTSETISLTDTDPNTSALNDVSTSQTLDQDVTLAGQTYTAGSNIETNYSYTLLNSATGETLTIYTIGINDGSGESYPGFISTAELDPNATYVVTATSGLTVADVDYADLYLCFAGGTQIRTKHGWRAVETLRPGDQVMTRDNGLQTIRWTGRKMVCGIGKSAPVHIAAGVFGNHMPLVLSPQHRVLLRDARAGLMFDSTEVMAPVKHLINGTSVQQIETPMVSYHHIALDRHEIIDANGAPCETLYMGDQIDVMLGETASAELDTVFPGYRTAPPPEPARPLLKGFETRALRSAYA